MAKNFASIEEIRGRRLAANILLKGANVGTLVVGDCMNYMKTLDTSSVDCVFMDPPDNLGLKYGSYNDRRPHYVDWLHSLIVEACRIGRTTWISYYHKYDLDVSVIAASLTDHDWRKIIWRYTFGQYNDKDFASGYRILLRLTKRDHAIMKPQAVLEESERQRLGDKRTVNTEGRVPDDVWDFPRVVGNSLERCSWHPTQHPVVLYDRIMKYSCEAPSHNTIGFLDLFAGTGTCFRAELLNPGIQVVGVEIDNTYCEKILELHRHVTKRF